MKLKIFLQYSRVYYPSVDNKERKKNGNVLNVNNVCFLEHERIRVYDNWECFPRSVKRLKRDLGNIWLDMGIRIIKTNVK